MTFSDRIAGLGHLIDGEIVAGGSGQFPVRNPSTGQVVASCWEASEDQLDQACRAAARAQPGWAAADEQVRRSAIAAMGAALIDNFADLNEIAEQEKGIPFAAGEAYMARIFADHLAAEPLPVDVIEDTDDKIVRLVRRPVGVVAAISPWNSPLLISADKVFTSLLLGNTIVVKPSPFSPLGTLFMGALWKDLVPPGVVNIVAGGNAAGEALVAHPVPRLVSFTGSVAAGKAIAASAARSLKNLVLELGGNDPAIILDDVDVPAVAKGVFDSAFIIGGQACAAIKRVYVHQAIHDQLVSELAALANAAVAAPPSEGGNFPPLITAPQYERVTMLVEDALSQGAVAVTGGKPANGPGYYYPPTILTNVTPGMKIVAEEQFGPVLPVIPFTDVEDAIAQANDTDYGLSGSAWSADVALAERIAARLECGTAYVNSHTSVAPNIPIGGFKSSGIGRACGKPGLDAYAELQTQIFYKKLPTAAK